jgi:hypothetical protein
MNCVYWNFAGMAASAFGWMFHMDMSDPLSYLLHFAIFCFSLMTWILSIEKARLDRMREETDRLWAEAVAACEARAAWEEEQREAAIASGFRPDRHICGLYIG